MTDVLIPGPTRSGFPDPDHPELLQPPVARAAYSNRTAYLMAHMSRMAYYKFEGNPDAIDIHAKKIAAEHSADKDKVRREIERFLDDYTKAPPSGLTDLQNELGAAGFTLLKTFDRGGTQAFLAVREQDRMAVLAFRGTEQNLGDIKTDLDFRFYKAKDGSKVHDGFRRAFEEIEEDIKLAYRGLSDYKVYITGHSLGGALALMATHSLDTDAGIPTDNLAACYTYGSPRVGTGDFQDGLRSPIYRVVNGADAVPRVPPSYLFDLVALLVKLLPVPLLGKLLSNLRGYRHVGDMRYLTETARPDYADVKLVANPDFFDRFSWTLAALFKNWKAGYERHAIREYCDKLKVIATARPAAPAVPSTPDMPPAASAALLPPAA